MSSMLTRLCAAIAAAFLIVLPACKTHAPAGNSNDRSQCSTVNGGPARVTAAARNVLEDLELKAVEFESTDVDGWAKARAADGTRVKVDIRKASETTSEVSVTVGKVGDPTLGNEILKRLQQRLGA